MGDLTALTTEPEPFHARKPAEPLRFRRAGVYYALSSVPTRFYLLGGLGGVRPLPREGQPPNLNDTSLRYVPMTLIDGERPEPPERGSVRCASARTGVRLGWDG